MQQEVRDERSRAGPCQGGERQPGGQGEAAAGQDRNHDSRRQHNNHYLTGYRQDISQLRRSSRDGP